MIKRTTRSIGLLLHKHHLRESSNLNITLNMMTKKEAKEDKEEELLMAAMEGETEVEVPVVAEGLIEEAIMIKKAKVLRKQVASDIYLFHS